MRLLFVSEKEPFLLLKSILGFYPHNIHLYEQALIHKSVAHAEKERKTNQQRRGDAAANSKAELKNLLIERNKKPSAQGVAKKVVARVNAFVRHADGASGVSQEVNNERLEFLGDAVLGAIVADILYKRYGGKQEGFLTTMRSRIVCRSSLNAICHELGLDKLIRHVGAITTAHNSFMSGNAFEAFIGAIYLDRGYPYCYRFVEKKVFACYVDVNGTALQEINFKSALIEWCQKYRYKYNFEQSEVCGKSKRNIPFFCSKIWIEGILCGEANGYSKKESDQHAAQQALKRIRGDKKLWTDIRHAACERRG